MYSLVKIERKKRLGVGSKRETHLNGAAPSSFITVLCQAAYQSNIIIHRPLGHCKGLDAAD